MPKKCIDAAKKEVLKLINILQEDLGINSNLIETYFSGNEGFHVHVDKTAYNMLESRPRAALGDYIRFYNAMPEIYGVRRSMIDRKKFPSSDDPGWHGRIAKKFFGKMLQNNLMLKQNMQNLPTISKTPRVLLGHVLTRR